MYKRQELPGTLASLQQELEAVTAKDLRRVAKRVFIDGPAWAVSVGPLDKEIREAAEQLAKDLLD